MRDDPCASGFTPADDKVGVIDVYQNKKKIKTVDLVVKEKVDKQTFINLLLNNLKNIPSGVMN